MIGQIHVDLYKRNVYSHVADPFLRAILTEGASSTRFHACERFDCCDYVRYENTPDSHVIYINTVNMSTENWWAY
jgi:hypothetical protein